MCELNHKLSNKTVCHITDSYFDNSVLFEACPQKKNNYTARADLKIDFINDRTPNCNLVRVFSFLPLLPPFWKTRGLCGRSRVSRVQSFPHVSHLRAFLLNQPNYPLREYPLWCLFMKISVYDRLYVDVRFLRNLGALVCTYSTFKINISQVLFA